MQLVKYERAKVAIAEAKAVDEVKKIRDIAMAMKAYATQANDHQLEIDASEIRIRAERRLGEMIGIQKETVGLAKPGPKLEIGATAEPNSTPTLADVGISKKLSARSQAIAAIPEDEFEATLAEHRMEQQAVTSRTFENLAKKGTAHVSHNSGENEWYTPPEYVEAARTAMGNIDLDPASCETANKGVKAREYFDAQKDGLAQAWSGNVFLNPPYAQPLIRLFANAVASKYRKGEIQQAVVLVNNATETEWFRIVATAASAICFPSGRIRFVDKHGKPGGAPLQGQAILYLGKNPQAFKEAFWEIGLLVGVCHER